MFICYLFVLFLYAIITLPPLCLCVSLYTWWIIALKSLCVLAERRVRTDLSLCPPLLCCSGPLSWMSSRNRLCWGWRLTTLCLSPRTHRLAKQWWLNTPSLSPRNTWQGVHLLGQINFFHPRCVREAQWPKHTFTNVKLVKLPSNTSDRKTWSCNRKYNSVANYSSEKSMTVKV